MRFRNLSGTLSAVATMAATAFTFAASPTAISAQSAQSKAKMTDPQVASVALTANSIDVDVAKIALSHTKNAEVRKFAESMVRDHSAVIKSATELATKLGVVPADNPTSESLKADATKVEKTLNGLSGAAFDKAYIDREVAYHEAVIGALDSELIPSTQNAEFKKFLENARPAFVAHLEHAKMVQKSLGK